MGLDDDELKKELQNRNPNPNSNLEETENNTNLNEGLKGKSCKGCLYYSSVLKSKSQNPTCIGIPKNLQQVPRYIVGETELEAAKEGRSLTDFQYGCVGYSVYLDNKDSPSDQPDKQAELPFCVGLEILLDRRASNADHVPAHIHKSEEGRGVPQPQTYKPPNSAVDEYLSRFKRNAGLVASGVARNVNKVGNYVKEAVEDILYPYRRK